MLFSGVISKLKGRVQPEWASARSAKLPNFSTYHSPGNRFPPEIPQGNACRKKIQLSRWCAFLLLPLLVSGVLNFSVKFISDLSSAFAMVKCDRTFFHVETRIARNLWQLSSPWILKFYFLLVSVWITSKRERNLFQIEFGFLYSKIGHSISFLRWCIPFITLFCLRLFCFRQGTFNPFNINALLSHWKRKSPRWLLTLRTEMKQWPHCLANFDLVYTTEHPNKDRWKDWQVVSLWEP